MNSWVPPYKDGVANIPSPALRQEINSVDMADCPLDVNKARARKGLPSGFRICQVSRSAIA
ncbi:hypothetical protein D3C86_1292610 [compost metagenome]